MSIALSSMLIPLLLNCLNSEQAKMVKQEECFCTKAANSALTNRHEIVRLK